MAKTKVPGGYIDDGSITSSHLHSSHGITTNDIGEHTNNKYYTDARVDTRLAASKSTNIITTGDIQITSDTGKAKFGTSNDFAIYHTGYDTYLDNATGHLVLRNQADDKDIVLQSDDGSGGTADYLRIDGSNTNMAVSKTMVFADNVKASFGAAEDLRIYHDGSNSVIREAGTGNLRLQTGNSIQFRNGSGADLYFNAALGGATTLYHNKVAKLATASDGIDVTGHIDATTLTTTGNVAVGGNLTVTGTTTTVNTVTMNAQNAVIFEGATADDYETTLTIIDPTADRTINLPNQSGTIPVLAAASNTAITATPAELNYVDGVTSNIQTQLNAKQATISSSTDLTLSSIVATSSNESRFQALNIGADSDVYLYESATNAFTIRTGASGAYKYFTFAADGKLNLANDGLQIGGTEVISGGRNLSNIGTGTFNGAVTMNSTLNVASTIGIAGTTVIDGSRNLTNIGTIGSGAITSSGLLTIGSGAGAIKINESFITARSSDNVNDINLIANINVYDADDVVIGSTSGQRFNDNIVFRTNGSQALRLDSSQNAVFGGAITSAGGITSSSSGFIEHRVDQTDSGLVRMGVSSGSAEAFIIAGNTGGNHVSSAPVIKFMLDTDGGSLVEEVRIDAAGLDIKNGVLDIAGTTVIDASRNLTNIGNATFGGNIIGNDIKAAGSGGLSLQTDEGTKRIEILDSGVVKFNQAYTFPTSDGSANQVLQTDGSGALSFATVSSGGSGFSTITEPAAGQLKIGAQSGANEGGEILLENAAANGGGSYTTNIHLDNYQNQFRVHAAGSVLFQTATGTGNTTVGGTLTSGDIFIEDSVTPKLTLKDTGNAGGGAATAKIVFANTAGDAIGIGYTSNVQSDSDLIISTNAGGTYGGYLGLAANGITDAQSDIILEPKTNVRIATGSLEMGTTAFVDQSRNVTAGTGTFSGNITASSKILLSSSHTKQKIEVYGGGHEWIGTSANTLELSGASINLNGGQGTGSPTLKYGGTTIMDTSRNMSNIGTISSGNITSSGTGSFSNLVNALAYQVSGTQVISSARNLENIGTISSGAITASGSVYAASGSNQSELTNVGSLELTRSAANSFIDFKSSTSEDYDCRIQQSGNGLIFQTGGSGSTATGFTIDSSRNITIGGGTTFNGNLTSQAGSVFGHGFTSGSRGFNFESGDESVGTIRFDANTMRFWSGGAGGGSERIRINDGSTGGGDIFFYGSIDIKSGGLQIADTTVINSSRGLTNITSANVAGNVTIDYTGNATNDAGLYVANDNSDWGIYVNKDGTGTYGIKIAADGAYPFQITNSSGTEKFRVDSDGDVILAGTVDGRDVAADGTKLDGIAANANNYSFPYTISTSASNNTVVRRTANGYIFANYFNTTANDVSSGLTKIACEVNNDSYIRWSDAAGVRSFINVGDLGGLSVHSGRNNEANKIVRTDANGYIQAGWINTTSGSTTTAMDRIYASNDGYIRYYTPVNFLNSGGFGDHLFNNQAQSHSSSTNFNTSMSAGVHYMQGGTNGPTGGTSHQFYGIKFGLGGDYSSSSAYSSQMYYPRADQGGGNGLYFRDMENGSWGSWRQVDAGTVGTLSLKSGTGQTGANQIIRSHSNGYIYHKNWIDIGAEGLFSSSINGFHFYPNQGTTYGTARINGTRGGYSGIMMDGGGDVVVGMFDGSGNGGSYREASSKWYHYFHLANTCMGINGSTTSSSYGLYVTGAIYATGDIVGSSDERLKTEIKTIPNALDKVLKLRGVTYKWIDPEEGGTCVNNITETRMGVIAQEVIDVVPEVVTHDKENDRYGVSYGHLTGVLIEAVKELKQEVNELKKELEEVKNG